MIQMKVTCSSGYAQHVRLPKAGGNPNHAVVGWNIALTDAFNFPPDNFSS